MVKKLLEEGTVKRFKELAGINESTAAYRRRRDYEEKKWQQGLTAPPKDKPDTSATDAKKSRQEKIRLPLQTALQELGITLSEEDFELLLDLQEQATPIAVVGQPIGTKELQARYANIKYKVEVKGDPRYESLKQAFEAAGLNK
jgi:hypothetical protein